MITGFEEQTHELDEKELRLLPFVLQVLKERKGSEAAINNAEIAKRTLTLFCEAFPEEKIKLDAPRLRKIVHHIRCSEELPLLCANSKGYYIAETREEAARFLESLRQRKSSLEELLAHLSIQFTRKYTPTQTSLDL